MRLRRKSHAIVAGKPATSHANAQIQEAPVEEEEWVADTVEVVVGEVVVVKNATNAEKLAISHVTVLKEVATEEEAIKVEVVAMVAVLEGEVAEAGAQAEVEDRLAIHAEDTATCLATALRDKSVTTVRNSPSAGGSTG